ncbi:Hypothetical predicted protein, partial [Paramuricea clavata]
MDDVRKFCLLRHAPAQVRLQLSGKGFESLSLGDLLMEADALTQRAKIDAQLVAAIHPKNNGKGKNNKKQCGYHRKFGKYAKSCTGRDKCMFWSENLRFAGDRPDDKGNDPGSSLRG